MIFYKKVGEFMIDLEFFKTAPEISGAVSSIN
jgi:hypothetical protein